MPEHARIRGTALTYAADELLIAPQLRGLKWSCIGCDAVMTPVAWNPRRTFKMPPHFRLEGQHVDCSGPDFRANKGSVYTGRYSQGIPSSLRLSALPAAPRQTKELGDVGSPDVERHSSASARLPQTRTDGSFSMIARSFVSFKEAKNHSLRLFAWPERTYEKTFWRLLNYGAGGPPVIPPQMIYFGPVARDELDASERDYVSFYLNRGNWEKAEGEARGKWASRFRVKVNLANQTDGHRQAIRKNIEQWLTEQAHMDRDGTEAVCCFFIGEQLKQSPLEFVVIDPRLICFLAVPKALFAARPKPPTKR